jgi:DNA modification methylase
MEPNKIYQGDALEVLKTFPDGCVNCCITSPPYYRLRDYGIDGQIGMESTPTEYVSKLISIFYEVKRVLRNDGTLWLNLGDSYAGSGKAGSNPDYQKKHTQFGQIERKERLCKPQSAKSIGLKPKDMIGIPWMVAFALREAGWYLRCDIIWNKTNCMPESVTDRLTKSHEYIFLLSKSREYYYDIESIKEPALNGEVKPRGSKGSLRPHSGRRKQDMIGNPTYTGFNQRYKGIERVNKRSVWTLPASQCKDAHFATFPEDLIKPCILAGCSEQGIALDPFFGSGTTGVVASDLNRNYVGIELNPEYIEIAKKRLAKVTPCLL